MGGSITRRDFLLRAASLGAVYSMGLGPRLILPSGRISQPEWNDEFTGDGADWTVAGTNDVTFGGGVVMLESGSAIHRASVPPMPFTVTAYCSSILYDDINTIYANATLAIADNVNPATTGPEFYGLEWDVDTLGSIAVYDGLFANYAATPTHLGTKSNETAGLSRQVPHYQRLVVRSGSDVDLLWSLDGVTWTTYATARNPGVTVEAVMLVSFGCETEWSWIRFS